jgi:hypothetical protein
MWKVVGRVVGGHCQVLCAWQHPTTFHIWKHCVPDNVHQPHVQQPSTYEKPEAASAVLGSWWWAVCHPKRVELHINKEWSFDTLLHLVGFLFINLIWHHDMVETLCIFFNGLFILFPYTGNSVTASANDWMT